MPSIKSVVIESNGFKRQLASIVLVLITLINTIPGCEAWAQALIPLAAALGVSGITHATLVGTLSDAKLAGLASLISIVLFFAKWYPPLHPYAPLLEALAALFSSAGLTLALPGVVKSRLS